MDNTLPAGEMAEESTEQPKTLLVTLPAELFERVAESVEARDLKALRAVNRESAAKVLRTYAATCFHTKSMLLEGDWSIRSAIAVAKHKEFNRAIKKVRIFIDTIKDKKAAPRDLRLALLTKFFTLLETDAPRDISLEICQLDDDVPPCQCSDWDGLETSTPDVYSAAPFVVVVAALEASEVAVRELTIGERAWTLSADIVQDHGWLRPRMEEMFKSLKHLSIGIWTGTESAIQTIAKLIASASQLESLVIRVLWSSYRYDCYRSDIVNDVQGLVETMAETTFSQLQTFRLDGANFSMRSLIDFAKRQKQLKSLSLADCALSDLDYTTEEYETVEEMLASLLDVGHIDIDEHTSNH